MLKRQHIHIVEIFSILLFSILANYLFDLKLDFNKDIDWMKVTKLSCLAIGSFCLYLCVYALKEIEVQSFSDFKSETDPKKKADFPIDKHFKENISSSKLKLRILLLTTTVSTILFFVIEPFVNYFF